MVARITSVAMSEMFISTRVIRATVRVDDAKAREIATTVGENLTIVAKKHAVCFTNIPSYVFARPTSTVIGTSFAATRSIFAVVEPTWATSTLTYISTGSMPVRIRSVLNHVGVGPKY